MIPCDGSVSDNRRQRLPVNLPLLNQPGFCFRQCTQLPHNRMVVGTEFPVFLFQLLDVLTVISRRGGELFQQSAGFITHVCVHQAQQVFQIKDRFTLA